MVADVISLILLMVLHYLPLSDAWMTSSPPILMRRLHRRSISSSHYCSSLMSSRRKSGPTFFALASSSTASMMVEESRNDIINEDSTIATITQRPTPQLRGLYTSPPPEVGNGTDEDGWITEVTNGTLCTDTGNNGSPHILYYEVHRRSHRYVSLSSSTTPSTPSTSTKKERGGSRLTALFLHGGPGAACNPNHVRFFDPRLYETVVLLDQRGCGRSTPVGEVRYNTLELLVDDIERLRRIILSSSSSSDNDDLESITTRSTSTRPWDTILGGSWGCTLAMAYAHAYPTCVRSMVLRGVCMFRTKEIDWLFGDPPSYDGDNYNNNNNKNNNNGMRSTTTTTANLRLLLEDGGDGRGRRRSDATALPPPMMSSITTATNNVNVITSGTTTATTVTTTAAEVFPTGWDEFRKGSDILRPRSFRFSKQQQRMTNAKQPTTTTTTSRRDTLHKYYNLILGSTDPMVRNDAVKSWLRWEMGIYSSGFRDNHRGPSTTTSATNQKEDEAKKNFDNNTVLVWYPSTSSWSYEDTRVWNNDSFVSIGNFDNEMIREQPPPDEMANSLRRFSTSSSCTTTSVTSTTSLLGIASLGSHEGGTLSPLPFHPMDATTSPSDGSRNNSTTPPTTYIPAQSMLTVFYSVNDDYCIGRYKSFLSMERYQQSQQSSADATANESSKSSCFSSALPPEIPHLTTLPNKQFSNNPESSSTKSTTTTSSFPLPPTIAIQGGNDAVCPPDTALDLHEIWKEMELRIVLKSGHSMYDPLIAGEIVKALDRFGYSLIDT